MFNFLSVEMQFDDEKKIMEVLEEYSVSALRCDILKCIISEKHRLEETFLDKVCALFLKHSTVASRVCLKRLLLMNKYIEIKRYMYVTIKYYCDAIHQRVISISSFGRMCTLENAL